MKVIFLDFDGVISVPASAYCLDRKKMELVKRICDETDAKIVISSSWRRNDTYETIFYIKEIQKNQMKQPFIIIEKVIGITPRCFLFELGHKESQYRVPRGCEIDRWLYKNKDVENYVILDDDTDMLIEQEPHFVHVNGDIGITEEDVEKAIKILNSSF